MKNSGQPFIASIFNSVTVLSEKAISRQRPGRSLPRIRPSRDAKLFNDTKKSTLTVKSKIPRRQSMGSSRELNSAVEQVINTEVSKIIRPK